MVKGLEEFNEDQFMPRMKNTNKNKQIAFNTPKYATAKNKTKNMKSSVNPEAIIPLDDNDEF
ncbi:hypothetical protein [Clostridium magnum]|uniref:Uncharacterized protein n=1 Tax=Clostridium magnum DSM 2767 TaxID=1121326 RepID=A0A162SRA8_9CLOT|nr:hypothetical protein [Clostridium magnum]KZL91763.1 hypothetical protein CLMAG_35220 [Clostridium magnum DSM 2767]SHJ02621.1 hypothetical protein SAMN02745944_05227 [Clostridium magnum DSM 2767]